MCLVELCLGSMCICTSYLSGGGRDVLVNFEITGALDMELWLRQTYYVNRRLTDNIHRT